MQAWLEQLGAIQQRLDAWQERFGVLTIQDDLNRSSYQFQGSVSDFPAVELLLLVEGGCRIEMELIAPSIRLVGSAAPRGVFRFDAADLSLAFEGSSLNEAQASMEGGDVAALLSLASTFEMSMTAAIENNASASGAHWIRREAHLLDALTDGRWLSFLTRIASSDTRRLVIADAGAKRLSLRGLEIMGPDATEAPAVAAADGSAALEYRAAFHTDDRPPLPTPGELALTDPSEWPGLAGLIPPVQALCGWCWLAERVTVTGHELTLRFEGARIVELTITPRDLRAAPSSEMTALWAWATESTDHDRRYALQQAASLALVNVDDLATGGKPILRTAKSIYDIAKKGAVAEAIATRRAVRSAAFDAGRSAADAARSTSSKVLERIILQTGAGVGILVAQSKELLAPILAARLLAVIFVLLLLHAIHALFEFVAAFGTLKAFLADVDRYADTLSREDLEDVKAMTALSSAKGQSWRAVTLVVIVLGSALAAAGLLVWRLLDGDVTKLA